MKLKRIGILLLIMLIIGLVPAAHAAVADPFRTISAVGYNLSNNPENYERTSSYVKMNGRSHSYYICFYDVYFDYAPHSVTIINGTTKDYLKENTYEIRLDDPNSEPVATVYITEALGWEKFNETVGTITQDIVGYHDVYISSSQANNFKGFYFTGIDPTIIDYRYYDGEATYPDISGNKHERAINVLSGLGVVGSYMDENYVPNFPVTRSEFAVMLSKFMTNDVPLASDCEFVDIEPEKEGYNEICYLQKNGIVTVSEDKKFNPKRFITTRDAWVMVLRMLGQEIPCMYKGGYPYGYDAVARDIGISNGFAATDYLRRDTAAAMLYSAIEAEFLDPVSIQNGTPSFEYKTGILSQKRGIIKSTGLVTSTIYGGVLAGDKSVFDTCTIDGQMYYIGDSRASEYLGVLCEYYYKVTESGDRILLYIGASSRTKQEFLNTNELNFSQINQTIISYSNKTTKKTHSIKIPVNTTWIYNHQALDVPITQVVNPLTFKGRIRIIDNGNGIETVFIEEYRNIKILSIDEVNKVITDELSDSIDKKIDIDAQNAKILISDGKKNIVFGDIPRGSLAELYISYDKSAVFLIVGETVVTGSPESLNQDGTVTVNGTKYYFAKEFKDEVVLGMPTEFHINRYGEIVYLKLIDSAKSVGLIYDIKKEDEKSIFYIITETDTIKKFVGAPKVFVDGERFEGYEDISEAVIKGGRYMPVLYRLNADGLLEMIDTPYDNKKNHNDTLVALNPSNYEDNIKHYYRKNMGVFSRQTSFYAHEYPVRSTATVFLQSATVYEDSACTIMPVTSFSSVTSGEAFVFYTFKRDSKIADLAHCVKTPARSSSGYKFFHSISKAINESGEEGINVNLSMNGAITSYWLSPNNKTHYKRARELKPGDYINITLNLKGHINAISIGCFVDGVINRAFEDGSTFSATVSMTTGTAGDSTKRWVHGTAEEFEDDYIKIVAYGATPKTVWCKIGDNNVVRVAPDGTQTIATGRTIKLGDRVLLSMSGSAYQTIVVYD